MFSSHFQALAYHYYDMRQGLKTKSHCLLAFLSMLDNQHVGKETEAFDTQTGEERSWPILFSASSPSQNGIFFSSTTTLPPAILPSDTVARGQL